MLSSAKVEQLIHRSVEPDTLDFKRELPDTLDKAKLSELVRDIIALANAAYDSVDINGYLLFGVEDKSGVPFDIRGEILLLKAKDRKPSGSPLSQRDIDAHNQRIFVKIAREYIVSATRSALRVNYSSWEHPDDPSSLVGVLEIRAQYGPYIVKKEIPKLDEKSKAICPDIQPGQAWIREGEDRRELLPNEIISMRDDARQKKRQARRVEMAVKRLGPVFQRWRMSFWEVFEGELPASRLIAQPLRTRTQLRHFFYELPQLDRILDSLGDKWYLNHLVISSPPGSGRTSLLAHLLTLRSDADARGRPIWIYQIPNSPDLDEFVMYIEKGLSGEIPQDTDRTLVFDLPLVQDSQLRLIEMLGKAFPKARIWATCNPVREGDLTKCLNSAFNRPPVVVQLPGYLDADADSYSSLLEAMFEKPQTVKGLLGENVVFDDIVAAHSLLSKGIEITSEYKYTHLEQLAVRFGKLTIEEQLVVKLISQLGGIVESTVHLMLETLNTPLNAYERLLESGLVYVDESSPWRDIRAANDLPAEVRSATENDVRYLVSILEKADLEPLRHKGWYLAVKLAPLGELVSDVSLRRQLDRLLFRLRGHIYCVHCDAYFAPDLKFCPNCGGTVDQKCGQVASSGKAPVPFPDLRLLRKGTFSTAVGVSSGLVRQLQETLPELKGGV